jgi:hypothetical protein
MGEAQAALLRRLGTFAAAHEDVGAAWAAGTITSDQVAALRWGACRLTDPQRRAELLEGVLPLLPGLDARNSRRLIGHAVELLQPDDTDFSEQSDHAARSLAWSRTPRGGMTFQGYLPGPEAEAFLSALDALVGALRTAGDGLSQAQRNADALSALVERARTKGLPTRGGLPAAMTLTVSLSEAQRIAARDPKDFGTLFDSHPRGGSTIGDAPAGDAAVRFGLCCGTVAPALGDFDTGSALARIAHARVEPLAVGRGKRLATKAQRRALRLRDRGCAIPDCRVGSRYTQPHHVVPWALDGPTDRDNLVSLCYVHHRQTELGHYTFIRRHPGQQAPSGALHHPRWWIIPPQPGRTE